ncbi:MAG: hypothetical protein LQ345_003105 [Seirophora villosa]|nr:MAG: hypothetical protein LQ345_003105 [Seirophora villosa]
MGVTKKVLKEGNGTDKPKKGDEVTIEYTGNLYDEANADNDYRGKQFDSSVGRGDFKTPIGVGRVIRGTASAAQVTAGNAQLMPLKDGTRVCLI